MDDKDKILDRIENDFTYHPPPDKATEVFYVEFREEAKKLARMIAANIPPSREASLALTNLEQAVMWGNAGVARNGLAR